MTKPPMRPKMFTLPDSSERTLVGNTCAGVDRSVDGVKGGVDGVEGIDCLDECRFIRQHRQQRVWEGRGVGLEKCE